MRKTGEKVFTAWRQKRRCHTSDSLWTDGETIWSYATPIVTPLYPREFAVNPRAAVVVNVTQYSATTSHYQRGLERALRNECPTLYTVPVDGIARGVSEHHLRDAGRVTLKTFGRDNA